MARILFVSHLGKKSTLRATRKGCCLLEVAMACCQLGIIAQGPPSGAKPLIRQRGKLRLGAGSDGPRPYGE